MHNSTTHRLEACMAGRRRKKTFIEHHLSTVNDAYGICRRKRFLFGRTTYTAYPHTFKKINLRQGFIYFLMSMNIKYLFIFSTMHMQCNESYLLQSMNRTIILHIIDKFWIFHPRFKTNSSLVGNLVTRANSYGLINLFGYPYTIWFGHAHVPLLPKLMGP